MNYIFLSDIDGTLLRADAPLTAQVVDAARNYTAQGGLLAVCTGRSLPAVTKVAEEIGVNAPSIIYGGAAIYDFQKKQYLYTQPFRWEIMQAVRAVLFTASQFPGVKKVEILVDGQPFTPAPEAATTFLNDAEEVMAQYPGVIEID